jgi:toxin YoeB
VKVAFTADAWDDYQYWFTADPRTSAKINTLIDDARRMPHAGFGKPEPLKGRLAGFWSRRITGEHRLVYTAGGKGGAQQIVIVQCRYHY